MSNHAINIATNGLIETSGTSISTFGYILEEYWKEAAPVIEEIIGSGGIEGVAPEWEKLDKKKKKKIIKLIIWYKTKKYEERKEVKNNINVIANNIDLMAENYKVTIDEVKSIVKEYQRKKEAGEIKIKVDNIKIK